MRRCLLTAGAMVLIGATPAAAFDEAHLARLHATGACESCDLSGATLRVSKLAGAQLRAADLSEADLISANLGGADLRGAG